jgi:uncharacterized protein
MRVVIDTNVFISALMFGGLPGALLDLALIKPFTMLTSEVLLDELHEKLCGKFRVSAEDAHLIRARITASAEIITPKETLNVITDDPDDNRVLECAVSGKADVMVSGDRHLLTLGSYQAIPILRVREFMERLEGAP